MVSAPRSRNRLPSAHRSTSATRSVRRSSRAASSTPRNSPKALEEANGDLLKFGAKLLSHYGVGRAELSQAVGAVCQVPVADVSLVQLDEEIVTRFPEEVARTHKVMPIAEENGLIVLYAADPSPWRRQQVESATGQRFAWKASDQKTVTSFIDADVPRDGRHRPPRRRVRRWRTSSASPPRPSPRSTSTTRPRSSQLVNRIVSQAMRDRSSDIHIEPLDDRLRIRFRIDGHLVEAF